MFSSFSISERIEASDLMCCEWCTEQTLPALFLQTSPQTCLHLQVQLDMFEDDSRMWCDCQSRSESQIQTLQQSTRDEVWLMFLLWEINRVKWLLLCPQMKMRNTLSLSLRRSSHSQSKSSLRKYSQRWASVIISAVFQLSCHLKKPVTDWRHISVPKIRRWGKACS